MPEALAKAGMLQGKNKVLLFRLLKEAKEKDATKLSFQTGHAFTLERDADAIVTKDGKIVKLGELEGEISGIEAVQKKEDPVAKMLQTAMIDGEMLEIWEVAVDSDLEVEGQYPSMYARGYLTSWEGEAEAEDEATYSGDFQIELVPQFGMATLSPEQQESVQYKFTDTLPVT